MKVNDIKKALIDIKHLNFSYTEDQDQPTINNMSLSIDEGQWVAIIGHNGSGKSTLAKLLDGLLEAQSGKIVIDGMILSPETVWSVRERIGLVFQNPDNQFVGATVEDDVAFGLENRGIPTEDMHIIVEQALKRVKMWAYKDREPASLSGGQKQRVALAGVLALQPKIMILDEATAMLDPEGRAEVLAILQEIRDEGKMTVLSITHDLHEASLADELIVINRGEIIKTGKPADIFVADNDLIEIGLDVPFTERLKGALRDVGQRVPEAYMDEERMVAWLCRSVLNK